MIPGLIEPNPSLLPAPTHPNYHLWRDYLTYAEFRGELVALVLAEFMTLSGACLLDLGAGIGGAALALSKRGAQVTAIEASPLKCRQLQILCRQQNLPINIITSTFPDGIAHRPWFDAVVLQDVIEHVENQDGFFAGLSACLKPGGRVFISTPNRWSPLNFITDPHWHLPVIAALNRPLVRFFIHQIYRRETGHRPDLPVLSGLSQLLRRLNRAGLAIEFTNRRVCRLAFKNPHYLLNDRTQLKFMHRAQKLALAPVVCRLVNDRLGIFNYFINPTWYLIARKRGPERLARPALVNSAI